VDLARRLTGIITTVPNGPGRRTAASAGYLINNRGLRDKLTHEDGTSWSYTYNDRGEVTSGKKHLANGSLAAGHNFGYQYDGIGNRREAKSGGNSSGIGQRTVTYTPNALNQYSSITTPGSFDVLVRSTNAVGVAVNGTPVSVASQGTFHRAQGTATNTAGAWAALTITSPVGQNSITGRRWLPPATFTPTQTNGELDNYDQDGNLLNDGRWANTWDAENRLITQTTTPLAAAAGVPRIKVENTYDWQSRRIGKKVSSSTNGTTWTVVSDERFVYERWNQLAVFAASGNTLSVKESNLWGLDLSGTLQGAGGVSGLLSVTINNQPSTINLFPAYDGNGNIIAWTDSNGVTKQRIDYDPFGNVVTREGDSGFVAPAWGFSTKYQDEETGLLYFGFRFYDSATGRWLSKDPIGEKGGINLYGFVANKSINCYDILGLNIERQVQKGDLNISYDVIKNANNPHNIEGFANSSVSDDLEGMTGLFVGGIDTWGQTSVPFGWASGTWGQWGSGVISWVEVQGAPWDWPHCNTVVNVRSKDAGAIFVNASLRKDSCCRKYVFYYSVSLKGDTTGDSAGVSSEMKTLGGSLSLRLSGRKNSKWLSRDEKRKGFMSKEICICPGESVLVASSKQSVTTNLAFANAQSWTAIDITDVKDMGECTK
jgi:RHS repeat-associated protein